MRSPLPNSVPSTRSAPAISPSSAVATAVPRSLCGCTRQEGRVATGEVTPEPLHAVGVHVRREVLDRGRQVHDHLRLRRRLPRPGDRFADLERVVELGVVEALGGVLQDDLRIALIGEAPAQFRAANGELEDAGAVEPEDDPPLHGGRRVVKVDDAAPTPSSDSYVRSISSGRAWVRTRSRRRPGRDPPRSARATNSKSVCDAEGNPTSISLKPSSTSSANRRRLRGVSIGLTSAWLPSRRSVEHQIGAA